MSSTLDQATSLFLRQHKDNPVAWRQWGPDALAEARAQDKPVFLSIGYVGCHWCHVMNAESFSDAETAKLINDNFIPILVDREERPDLDLLYQAASQVLGHGGGWPLHLFLLPDGRPFLTGGYMAREEREGQIALTRVLANVASFYRDDRDQVLANAQGFFEQIEALYNRPMAAALDTIALDAAALRMGQRFDLFLGGVTGTMKFPAVTALDVLWRAFLRTGTPQYMQLVTGTVDSLILGGLYDHVGGGFFRYAMDERWHTPHFEKSLTDNALLIGFLTSMWQFNRSELCRQRVSATIDWLLRDMKLGNGFAAGTDAGWQDGEEGRYYTWSEAEIDAALLGTFSTRFKQMYGVRRDGPGGGRNLPRLLGNVQGVLSDADEALLTRQRSMLLEARGKRGALQRDDKLLTDRNGFIVHALAFAGAAFDRADWVMAAIAAYDHVRKVSGEGDVLYHSFNEGQRGERGYADDYAAMARAAMQLWEVTGEARFLDDARTWTAALDSRFWSDSHGGYCFTEAGADPLIVRVRNILDLPAPSGNAMMISVLTRLALITGEGDYRGRALGLMSSFVGELARAPMTCGEYLAGFECYANSLQIVIVGPRGNPRTQELIRAVWGKPLPDRLLLVLENTDALPEKHPARAKEMQNGQPTAYICQRDQCSQPTTSAATLAQALTLPQPK